MSVAKRAEPAICGGVFFRSPGPDGFEAGTKKLEKCPTSGNRTRGRLALHAGFQPACGGLFYNSVRSHRIPARRAASANPVDALRAE